MHLVDHTTCMMPFTPPVPLGLIVLRCTCRTICARYGIIVVSEQAAREVPDYQELKDGLNAARNVSYADHMVAIVTHMQFSESSYQLLKTISISPPRPMLFTSLRNAVSRTYSSYVQDACMSVARQKYQQAYTDQCGGLSGGNSDIMQQALQNDTDANRWDYIKASPGNMNYNYMRGNASSPTEVLKMFDFIFVMERMDESLVVFMLEYGLQFADIAHLASKNRTGKYRSAKDMPAEMNAYIEKQNHEEIQLWKLANQKLDSTIAALKERCGPNVVSDALQTFRHMQAEVFKECHDFKSWYKRHHFGYPFTHFGDQGMGPRCVHHVVSKLMRSSTKMQPIQP